eukprot:UN22936
MLPRLMSTGWQPHRDLRGLCFKGKIHDTSASCKSVTKGTRAVTVKVWKGSIDGPLNVCDLDSFAD